MRYKGPDRRKGPDFIVKTFHRLSTFSMIINVALVLIFSFAKPRMETMFDRFAGSSLSGSWNQELVFYLKLLLFIQLLISLTGIILNLTRHHRKRDHYSVSLFISLGISILGLIILF